MHDDKHFQVSKIWNINVTSYSPSVKFVSLSYNSAGSVRVRMLYVCCIISITSDGAVSVGEQGVDLSGHEGNNICKLEGVSPAERNRQAGPRIAC